MAPAAGGLERELPAEVGAIGARAPEVEIAVPPGKPNTELAIRYGAAALRTDPAAGRGFVRSLYRGFWVGGLDLSDAAVLASLAENAGLAGLEPGPADAVATASWQRAWQQVGPGGVPLIVRPDGESLYGLVGAERLRDFVADMPR